MDSSKGACHMKIARLLVAVVCLAACAAFPTSSAYPSPGSLSPSTTVASQGSVFFVTTTEAWEVTQPPDQLHTVVLQTKDAGAHWTLWGVAPEAGSPVGFSATEVLLSTGTHLLRSTDGANWITREMPTSFGLPTFLPDLQHGWVGGFPIYFPPASPSPTVPPGKGGGGGTTGKGGGGGTTGKGGGGSVTGKGGSAAPGASPCNDKGCQPIELFATSDGGATWRLLLRSTVSEMGGGMYFFSATTGIIEQNASILVTQDGGVTWRPRSFSVPGVTSDQPATALPPTMFDAKNGVLPIQTATGVYLSTTTDGGLSWSDAEHVNDCVSCTGAQMAFLDRQHWIDYSQGVSFTADAGQTWKKATTTNPSKTASGVELVTTPSSAVFVLAAGLFASESTDWGVHWRAVALPDIYPTYRGFAGQGGWNGP